jgi:hypothetical protein
MELNFATKRVNILDGSRLAFGGVLKTFSSPVFDR